MGRRAWVDSGAGAMSATIGSRNAQRVPSRTAPLANDLIALAVRWYVKYHLSYADVVEWLAEHGVMLDRSTVYRWVRPLLAPLW